jgi:lipoate-protein ligase A
MFKKHVGQEWRLLPTLTKDGFSHMAIDQALLEAAASPEFPPSLRFIRWSPPALSIGRFQAISDIDLEKCSKHGVDVVRRPTGGKCLLHIDDFTYSVILPAGFDIPDKVEDAYKRICVGITTALRYLGLQATVQARGQAVRMKAGSACFAVATKADVEYEGHKICGSAQVRKNGALLQHGSIMIMDHSKFLFNLLRFESEREREENLNAFRKSCMHIEKTGCICTWEDLADSFRKGFSESFGAVFKEGKLSAWEEGAWRSLVSAYRSEQWLKNARADDFPEKEGLMIS